MMISFLGLGNPGSVYAETKHNAGFWVLDELSKRWKLLPEGTREMWNAKASQC